VPFVTKKIDLKGRDSTGECSVGNNSEKEKELLEVRAE
jgi:hypothetical protein